MRQNTTLKTETKKHSTIHKHGGITVFYTRFNLLNSVAHTFKSSAIQEEPLDPRRISPLGAHDERLGHLCHGASNPKAWNRMAPKDISISLGRYWYIGHNLSLWQGPIVSHHSMQHQLGLWDSLSHLPIMCYRDSAANILPPDRGEAGVDAMPS